MEGNTAITTIDEIKFSWDDNFVGINTINPDLATIFSTENLKLHFNSKSISPNGIGFFNFTGNNKYILLFYPEWEKEKYNLFFVNRYNLELEFTLNVLCYPITTSAQNQIFTGSALLKPKTVGVIENMQNRLLISPNPASDYIEINVGAGSKPALENPGIEIYNIFGEKITTPSNLAGLPPLKRGISRLMFLILPQGYISLKLVINLRSL